MPTSAPSDQQAAAANAGHTLRGISSMATRQVLADLLAAWQADGGIAVELTSVGGVDAAQRVQAGEALDLVFLASDAIDRLLASGHLLAGSKRDLMRSTTAVAVAQNAAVPDIASLPALQAALLAAPSIGYSTGPSGQALLRMLQDWGLYEQLQARLVQASPGIPVARLIAQGTVALGFQQRSELIHEAGIHIVGDMPAEAAIETIFSGAVLANSPQPAQAQAQAVLAFMASPAADAAKRLQGMAAL